MRAFLWSPVRLVHLEHEVVEFAEAATEAAGRRVPQHRAPRRTRQLLAWPAARATGAAPPTQHLLGECFRQEPASALLKRRNLCLTKHMTHVSEWCTLRALGVERARSYNRRARDAPCAKELVDYFGYFFRLAVECLSAAPEAHYGRPGVDRTTKSA